jgi:NAD(P)-dependent dehydrogenase (short-subunit alcohol dehydrogenase family)
MNERSPDMSGGNVALVTGANAGLGKALATALARQGATVVMLCRDAGKGEEARREIARETGNPGIELLIADLADQEAVREAARQFREHHPQLHLLVNNAGAHIQQRRLSPDGIELNLAVNHLSSFLLTQLLLDPLRASAPARIVNVASASMTRTIDLDDLQGERAFAPFAAYGQAKLAMVLCTYALARRLKGTGVTVNALHPGLTGTHIVDDVAPPLARPFLGIIKRFLLTPEQGARTALYLATSPAVAAVSGKYFVRERERPSVPISYDEALQERVWAISAELTHSTP